MHCFADCEQSLRMVTRARKSSEASETRGEAGVRLDWLKRGCSQSGCRHGGNTKELFCDSEICHQDCFDDCNMTCLSSVKDCFQSCHIGTCFYQCDAQTCHVVSCFGGKCPQMKVIDYPNPCHLQDPKCGHPSSCDHLTCVRIIACNGCFHVNHDVFFYLQSEQLATKLVETLCPKGSLWRFANLKKRKNKAFPSPPLPQMVKRGKGCGPFEDIVSTILLSIVP